MIFKRYGDAYHSVEANFDSNAMSEVSFRRNRKETIHAEELEAWERIDAHELSARAEGDVHGEVEQTMLDDLLAQLEAIVSGLGEGELVVIESEAGRDWPRTRQTQKNVVVEGENRLYFHVHVEPPLRVAVHRKDG
ncbi:MAG: hypothetical protein PVI57_05445 [Gemmatimonadota bacterium]|jgi:hypothetical protein